MDLIPVTADYDQVAERMRQFAATRLMEMLEGLRPFIAEALADPAGIHDIEPGRLTAFAALIKLQNSMIKELGLLYRVQDRPREDREETVPLVAVQQMLAEAEVRMAAAVAAAALEARMAAELAAVRSERLSLEAARASVAAKLAGLG